MAEISTPTEQVIHHGLATDARGFWSGAPVLAGSESLRTVRFRGESRRVGDWHFVEKDGLLLGAARTPARGRKLASAAASLYGQLFPALADQNLYRIWHFVPEINQLEHGLENYRAFCLGRHTAFDEFFGEKASHRMPAASAVGSRGSDLVMWVLAGRQTARFLENPSQIPAYRYPAEYGPRPPCFARATLTPERLYVSGTSSIRGHATVAPGDVHGQVAVTLENLRIVLAQAGCDFSDLRRPGASATVYLRHPADLDRVHDHLTTAWGNATDAALYLQADICRIDLDVEIECQIPQIAT